MLNSDVFLKMVGVEHSLAWFHMVQHDLIWSNCVNEIGCKWDGGWFHRTVWKMAMEVIGKSSTKGIIFFLCG